MKEKLKELVDYDWKLEIVKTKRKFIEKEFLHSRKFYLGKQNYVYVHFYKLQPNDLYPDSKPSLVFKMGKKSFRMIFDTFDDILTFISELGLFLVDTYSSYYPLKNTENTENTGNTDIREGLESGKNV